MIVGEGSIIIIVSSQPFSIIIMINDNTVLYIYDQFEALCRDA